MVLPSLLHPLMHIILVNNYCKILYICLTLLIHIITNTKIMNFLGFISQQGHWLVKEGFYGFSQFLQYMSG